MFRTCLISLLLLMGASSSQASNYLIQQHDYVLVDVVEPAQQTVERPAWSKTIWGNILFVMIVVAIIFGGAYGIHLYQIRHLHKRADDLEHIVTTRTDEVNRMNTVHQEVINALITTNDALLDTNTLLENANERLSWANNQLSHTNRELEMRTSELNFALEQNREILGITAHDLKNPLGGIVGLSEIVQEDLANMPAHENAASVLENLGLIQQAARHMLTNVQTLLERHGQGPRGPLQKEEVYLNDIILTTLKWNKQQAKNKGLKIFFSGQHEKVAVRVDISAIQRVMDNLISNAIKYSSLYSKIWVEMLQQEEYVWVSVRDEGPGLTEEDMRRVFGREEKLSARPTAGEHSSGYGLYIVKQIIDQHGGQVGVESVLGEGSAFWFKIKTVESDVMSEGHIQFVV